MNNKEYRILYGVLIVMVLTISTIGSTYAYFSARTNSLNNSISTSSTIYSISMDISPVYSGFSYIPMNDEYALKALKNKCKDKYDRGACSAYRIRVYGYNEGLDYISGVMDITTDNMVNLSYMMYRLSNTYDEDKCVDIDGEYYCISYDATSIGEGTNLSLGDSYDVRGMTETKFILMIWLTNLNESQNESDIGNYNATITMQAGSGGEIKGTIANAIVIDDGTDNGTEGGNNGG